MLDGDSPDTLATRILELDLRTRIDNRRHHGLDLEQLDFADFRIEARLDIAVRAKGPSRG